MFTETHMKGLEMRLYNKLLKMIFFKAKETKWIVCITALVITVISMLMTCGKSIERSYSEALHQTSQYNFRMHITDENDLKKYSQLEYWDDTVTHIAVTTDVFDMYIEDSPFYFNVTGLAGDYELIYKFNLLEGEYPSNDREIVVDSKFIDNSQDAYKVGDKITLSVFLYKEEKYKDIEYTISGIFQTNQTSGAEVFAFCNIDGGKRAINIMGENSGYNLLIKLKDDSLEVLSDASNFIEDKYYSEEMVTVNGTRYAIYEDASGTKGGTAAFRCLGIFIGIVAATLLYNMLQVSVGNQVKQSGMIRSIGLKRRQLITMYALNLLLYTIISMVFGLAITLLLENTIGDLLFERFLAGFNMSDYVDFSFKFSWTAFFTSVAVVVIIFTIVYVGIIIKAIKLTPLEAIRYQGDISSKVKVKKVNYNKVKAVSFMGSRNLSRNKGRTVNTAFSFFVSALLLMIVFMVALNTDIFDMDVLDKSNRFDYEFYKADLECDVTHEIIEDISNLDSVKKVAYARRNVDEFWLSREQIGLNMNDSEERVDTRVYCNQILEILCAANSLDYDKWKDEPCYLLVGDNVDITATVVLYDENDKKYEIEPDGSIDHDFYTDYYNKGIIIVMNEHAAKQLYPDGYNYNVMYIISDGKIACKEDVNAVLQSYGIQMIHNDLEDIADEARTQLTSIICVLIYLLFCICIMTVANLICNININVQLRKREYGILMALGMDRRDMVKLIIGEIAIVAERMLLVATPIAMCVSSFFIIGLEQPINIVKLICIAVIEYAVLYALTYFMCYRRGNKVFEDNVLRLMNEE